LDQQNRRLLTSGPIDRVPVPLLENALRLLMDLLFAADELLELVRAPQASSLHWTEPHVQRVYDEVNTLMKRLSD
jgi:hypothetical protein